jgi:ATP-dependent Clp protease ATP-binding subunit ClpC
MWANAQLSGSFGVSSAETMAQSASMDRVGRKLTLAKQKAQELARAQQQTLTTCHLVAVAMLHPGTVGELLLRETDLERFLRAAETSCESRHTNVERTFIKAHDLARSMGHQEPTVAHLVMAVLSDPASAGRRALERLDVDIQRLRSQIWNLEVGLKSQPAPAARHAQPAARQLAGPTLQPALRRPPVSGVTIPLFPPPPVESNEASRPRSTPPPRSPATNASASTEAAAPSNVAASTPETSRRAKHAALRVNHDKRPTEAISVIPVASPRAKRQDTRFDLDPKQFPILSQFGTNLTREAAANRLDPVHGRDDEIEKTLDVLAKRHGNSPCLIGPAGVGKTSVVRGLALRIAGLVRNERLDDRIVVEIPVSELLAGTGVRGALAQRCSALRKEVQQANGRVVVFFDEIHLLFVGDAADESAGEFKLALSRGEFPCIGATTPDDYRRSIETDPALARRFCAIEVEEPRAEDAFLILESCAKKLEEHHGIRYAESALALSISWSVRYLPGRMLPEKAIAIADLAGARARRRRTSQVDPEHIAEVVSEMANLPIERLLESDGDRMLALERLVGGRVVGHAAPIQRICQVLRRNAAGLGSDRPIGTFLLLGPTGVGKTETAKALAQTLFHSETAMTRLDMAEYSEPHAVARLIGAPPGYIGHDAGGQLTEAVRKRPYQVLLLDEIEKAHNDVLQAFLGVFDEGRLTDGRGRTIDFRNTIILMTSNLGSEHTQAAPRRRVGFAERDVPETVDTQTLVIAAARARLSPELYNRIDEVLVFGALNPADVREIARRLLAKLGQSLETRGVTLEVSEAAIDCLLAQGGYDLQLGARPMKRMIARLVEAPLAEMLLSGSLQSGMTVKVASDGQRLDLQPRSNVSAKRGHPSCAAPAN